MTWMKLIKFCSMMLIKFLRNNWLEWCWSNFFKSNDFIMLIKFLQHCRSNDSTILSVRSKGQNIPACYTCHGFDRNEHLRMDFKRVKSAQHVMANEACFVKFANEEETDESYYWCNLFLSFSISDYSVNQCYRCGKIYQWKGSLRTHMRVECGKKPTFKCPVCLRMFKHKHRWQSHAKRLHHIDLSWWGGEFEGGEFIYDKTDTDSRQRL